MAKEIQFTQFIRPNGRPVEVSVMRPDHIGELAERLIQRGYGFECEQLSTSEVSLTIVDEHGDQDIEIVPNGAEVPLAVDRMIERFAKRIAA
jgi:hypothetical protein